ncbi:hypothetical protein KM043_009308 [Ampulex compressa]|nr:hypothetical protein KM043_009308 [Ampulex compressa]
MADFQGFFWRPLWKAGVYPNLHDTVVRVSNYSQEEFRSETSKERKETRRFNGRLKFQGDPSKRKVPENSKGYIRRIHRAADKAAVEPLKRVAIIHRRL